MRFTLLLNVFQSPAERYPFVAVVAWVILITGVVPPLEIIGAVPVTEVTPAPAADHVNCPVVAFDNVSTWLALPVAIGQSKVYVVTVAVGASTVILPVVPL